MANRLAVQLVLIGLVTCGSASRCQGQVVFSGEARQTGGVQHAGRAAAFQQNMPESVQMPMDAPLDTFPTMVEQPCDGCEVGCSECAESRLFLDAWLAQGVTLNMDSPDNRFNTPMTFNDRSNDYQMNQLYVSTGWTAIQDGCNWDVGAQADFLYGTDYFFTTAVGLETELDGTQRWNGDDGPRGAAMYGLAMPQLFAEIYAPIAGGITFRLGHFYSTLGYETVAARDNFFYSHSYAFQYGEPKTHTGFLAQVPLAPNLAMHAGMTRGWDTWEDPNDTNGFLGGLNWVSWDEQTSLAFALHTGSEDPAGENDRTVYSLVLTRYLSPCLTYVFEHDFGTESQAKINGDFSMGRREMVRHRPVSLQGGRPRNVRGISL